MRKVGDWQGGRSDHREDRVGIHRKKPEHQCGKIQFAVGGTWELYQEYADCGYTHNNVHYTKTGHNKVHMCWTQKGRLFLYDFLKKEGILPKIEQPRQEAMV